MRRYFSNFELFANISLKKIIDDDRNVMNQTQNFTFFLSDVFYELHKIIKLRTFTFKSYRLTNLKKIKKRGEPLSKNSALVLHAAAAYLFKSICACIKKAMHAFYERFLLRNRRYFSNFQQRHISFLKF